MRLNKRTIAGLGMKVLGKGLLTMAEENLRDNVVDFDANEAAQIRLLINQIKTLLEIKAKDFASQYIERNNEKCPEYLIDDEFGVTIIEQGLAKCFDKDEWNNADLLNISAHAFGLVVVDHIAEYFGIESDEDDEDDEDDEGDK